MGGFGVSVTADGVALEDITFALTCQPLMLHVTPVGSSDHCPDEICRKLGTPLSTLSS